MGTIYPSKNTKEFMYFYFYGNNYTIWNILKKDFPNLDIYSYDDVSDGSKKIESAGKIKSMLSKNNITISDLVKVPKRKDGAKFHVDFFEEETEYNIELIE
ncbi:MAG: hypothetical protein KFW21_01535 [Spirochaetota bacterium]|nr:hypothetical protein [Spirochaetota bacterium]